MKHTISQIPLELLQAIVQELIRERDPDATFVNPEPEPEAEPKPTGIGIP